jgi:uncharacterized protein
MNEEYTPDETVSAPMAWPTLKAIQVRVLGCLMEKAVTTPEYYPLTLNSLTNACNQKSNRDPLMSLSEDVVVQALDTLRHTHRLVALVHTAGSRTEKFKHTIGQIIPLNPPQAAVLCELFLRGPETVGELRTRASRLHPFQDLDEVQQILDALARHPGGALVVKLPREPGRREPRWMHLLAGQPEMEPEVAGEEPSVAPDAIAALQEEIRELRAECMQIRTEWEDFRRQFE